MSISRPDDPTPSIHREYDPFFCTTHLPGVRRRQRWIEGDDKQFQETFALALEADCAATEACLALEHERELLALNASQRSALDDSVYALNRLVLELQCYLLRIAPIGKPAIHHLVAYLIYWRKIGPQCYAILHLPEIMRVRSRPTPLNKWRPSVRSLEDIRVRYANSWAQDAFG